MNSNCMIANLDSIARMNRVCNDVGVDTMDVGGAIAVAMEAGLLGWGDGKAALDLVKEIGKFTDGRGDDQQRMQVHGRKVGSQKDSTGEGSVFVSYDPRGLKGLGVTYATSPMGGEHLSVPLSLS